MESFKVIILISLLVVCLGADNSTTNATTTTTTVAPTNMTTTLNTTTAVITNAPTNATTTASTTNSTDAMTTVTTTIAKKLGCGAPLCPPYSLCGPANECLMICPNATAPAANSSMMVCGSNDITYASFEEMKMKSCEAEQLVTKDHDGKCVDKEEGSSTKYIIIVIVLVLVLIVIVGIAVYWVYSKKKTQSKDLSGNDKTGDNLL